MPHKLSKEQIAEDQRLHDINWSGANLTGANLTDAAALREKLDDCLETLRLIEKVTRPDGAMADAAVNLLIRSCRWHAFEALRSRLSAADDMLREITDQNDHLEALNRESNASWNDWKACAERTQARLSAIEAAASAAVLAYGAHAHAQLRELFNESRHDATLKALDVLAEAMSNLDIALQGEVK